VSNPRPITRYTLSIELAGVQLHPPYDVSFSGPYGLDREQTPLVLDRGYAGFQEPGYGEVR
jgi:hypothetical protein